MSRVLICAAALAALPSSLLAHPGHGSTDPGSVAHYAVEPLHWMPVASVVLGFVAASLAIRYWKRLR